MSQRLYDLLPAIYRRRDLEQLDFGTRDGNLNDGPAPPLEALFAVLQTQFDALESETSALYDDWFVETASPDALRRIAEPFDLQPSALLDFGADTRALVANILRYRQSKGTVGAFESYASNLTGWTVRLADGITRQARIARVDDTTARRPMFFNFRTSLQNSSTRAFNVRDAGAGVDVASIEVWRAHAVRVENAEPWQAPDNPSHRKFNPAGVDVALLHIVDGDGERVARATFPWTREDARAALNAGRRELGFVVRDAGGELTPSIEDLSLWMPAAVFEPGSRSVIIDPELGRFLVADDRPCRIDCTPTAPDGIGAIPPTRPWGPFSGLTIVVRSDECVGVPHVVHSLQDALDAAAGSDASHVRIVLVDSDTIRDASGWTYVADGGPDSLAIETAQGARPTLDGALHFSAAKPCTVFMRGLLVRGDVRVGPHVTLDVRRCSLPGRDDAPAIVAEASDEVVPITLRQSMVGTVQMESGRTITVEECIVTGELRSASSLTARRTTFIRTVRIHEVSADDSVFNDELISRTTHTGYLRFCLLHDIRATLPVRFRCVETAKQILESAKIGRPRFARLNADLPPQAFNGSSEGSEIGAFSRYAESTRLANLHRAMAEYLPMNVSAHIEFHS